MGVRFMAGILVVDDDREIRDMLKRLLERAHYDVETAEDGKQALQMFQAKTYDVVITDILMPEKEGIETIIELRKQHSDLKIIAISGGGRGDAGHYLQVARAFGADRSFGKPFECMEILQAMEELTAESLSVIGP
jgi:DNA-binding response OmpR family regulator